AQQAAVLGQGRDFRAHPASDVGGAGLRRGHRARQGGSDRRCLPHRRSHLLRRRRTDCGLRLMPTGEDRARRKVSGPWISRTGLRLALAFVVAALLSIGTIISIAGATISGDVSRLVNAQGTELTKALALASARAYRPSGWDRPILNPVLALVAEVGAAAQVRSTNGDVVRGSADFETFPPEETHREPVLVP